MEIRELFEEDIEKSMELVREVFMEFEAPEYEKSGVNEFLNYIETSAMKQRVTNKELRLWGCFEGGKLIGVIALKDGDHISLLFVKKDYHRRGIARSLFEQVKQERIAEGIKGITVNSSPYAEKIYAHLGFTAKSEEQTVNGIRFIPMAYNIK